MTIPRISLRATVALAVGVAAALGAIVSAAVVVTNARTVIYESRQNALLDELPREMSSVDGQLKGHEDTRAVEYQLELLPGTAAILDPSTGTVTGEFARDDVPAALLDRIELQPEQTRFQRGTLDGAEVFFMTWSPGELDDGTTPVVISVRSLEPQRAQVDRLVTSTMFATLAALGLLFVAGLLLGTRIAAPLKRLRESARALGDGRHDAGTPSHFSDVLEVATAMQSSGEKLIAARDELAMRERHARQLVSDVAHELRTPLTSMLAVTEILDEIRLHADEGETAAIDIVIRSTDRLAVLVEQLLQMSSIDAGAARVRVGEFSVDAQLVEAIELAGGSGVVQLLGETGAVARTDATRVKSIVSNLVRNALIHGAHPVTVSAAVQDGVVAVLVSDAGTGIDVEARARVFERFVTLADAGRTRGSGLGLAIARENARLLGGELILLADDGLPQALQSRLAVPSTSGASFLCTFPLTVDSASTIGDVRATV